MNQSPSLIYPHLATRQHSAATPRIAMIAASWHADIVQRATDSFAQTLAEISPQAHCDLMQVPGVFEIPLQAKRLAQSGEYDAIVAFGFVVDGGIYRHDFVSTAVIDGLMRVQLDTLVPVLSVVLTPHHFHSGQEHQEFFHSHFVVKGREAANACAQILQRKPSSTNQTPSTAAVAHELPVLLSPVLDEETPVQASAPVAFAAATAAAGELAQEDKPAVWSVRGSHNTALNSSN